MRGRNGNLTSGTLHVEHMRMEMAKIFQEVDRLGGTRVGTEGEGHLVSQSAIGIAFRAAKRSFDIAASVVGMVVLSPLLLATAVAVKFTSQGPVIFKQKRYGKDEVPFTCYKFRTMKIDTPPNIPTRVMREDKAVMTPIGAMLRKTSIDELPQLVNIVKGDMSVIGPRPMILADYEQIEARARYGANDIRPGLTGWAQINGRDAVTVEEKARLDGEYRRNMGFRLDARIFFRSFVVVLGRFGYAEIKEEDGQAYSDFSQEDEVGLCESPSGGRAA